MRLWQWRDLSHFISIMWFRVLAHRVVLMQNAPRWKRAGILRSRDVFASCDTAAIQTRCLPPFLQCQKESSFYVARLALCWHPFYKDVVYATAVIDNHGYVCECHDNAILPISTTATVFDGLLERMLRAFVFCSFYVLIQLWPIASKLLAQSRHVRTSLMTLYVTAVCHLFLSSKTKKGSQRPRGRFAFVAKSCSGWETLDPSIHRRSKQNFWLNIETYTDWLLSRLNKH